MVLNFDFLSRQCKDGDHDHCEGKWTGLGIVVRCNCNCSHRVREKVLGAEILGAFSPNNDTSLLAGIQHDG